MKKEYPQILNKIRNILSMEPLKFEEEVEDVVLQEGGTQKFNEATLEDGTVIYYDGDLAVGTAVFSDSAMTLPVENGEYILSNGDKFTTVDGVVTVFLALVPETEEEPEVVIVEEEALKEDFEKKYNELITVVEDLKKQLEKFTSNELQLKEQIAKLSAEPEVGSVTQKPQETLELTAVEKRLQTLDVIRRMSKKNK